MPISVEADILSSRADTVIEPAVLSNETLTKMYRDMVLIRRVEESLLELAESGKIGGAMRRSVTRHHWAWRQRTETIIDLHLSRYHHSLARHGPAGDCRVLSQADGFAKGKGARCASSTVAGADGNQRIVGTGCRSDMARQQDSAKVASYITFFRDSALYQGVMHETFNMSLHWLLPSFITKTTAIRR